MKQNIDKLLRQPMSREVFLRTLGAGLFAFSGLASVHTMLTSKSEVQITRISSGTSKPRSFGA